MTFSSRIKLLEKLMVDNSPVLLTAIGVAGTIGTALLTHKATQKATCDLLVEDAKLKSGEPPLSRREVFDLTWKHYIPPVVSGAATVGAIVLANHIGTKRAAALAAAYTISDKAYTEYREKVIEKIGEAQERKVRDDIVRERIENNPQSESNVVLIGSGDVLCYEMYTDRYFNSSVEAIKKAVNEVNYSINTHRYASVSDFYQHLGLPNTSISDEMGWSSDKLMDVDITTVLSPDGRPCVAINFMTGPVRDFHRFR